ncbi:Z1 domain-containing protein [Streptomyces sp. NPDC005078]|uniref:Z1 domain-containing protein n=1 Tax=unclassified Streptomyces TaxID=2593676 RepID=UPI00339E49A5
MQKRRGGAGRLGPFCPDATPERLALASKLRELFTLLDLSLRAYATKQGWAASQVSRFFNGDRPATEQFVRDLLHEVSRKQGPLPESDQALVWRLYDADVDARRDPSARLVALQRSHLQQEERIAALEAALAEARSGAPACLAQEIEAARRSLEEREAQIVRIRRERDELARKVARILTAASQTPRSAAERGTVVISAGNSASGPQRSRNWYWPAYARLLDRRGWAATVVAGVEAVADEVVKELADPSAAEPYQTRGLILAPVGSGRVAAITGVVAKAMDVGYRLVIVLSKSSNEMRHQLQRRLDKDLVGRENVTRGESDAQVEYADDPDWYKDDGFLRHGQRPSQLGAFDIIRLTTSDSDVAAVLGEVASLEFEKREPELPLYDPRNLHDTAARLIVVKKNKSVLTKLVRELERNTHLSEVPTLIVDDAMNSGPLNAEGTQRESGPARAGQTALNRLTVELLRILPRAQYVTCTTTPFADQLLNPYSEEGTFPKDFIVALPQPDGVVAMDDFDDTDGHGSAERTFANSRRKAHLRTVHLGDGDDDSAERLVLDMFLLTAAMKLYRAAQGTKGKTAPGHQHHTMLVHTSQRVTEQRAITARLMRLWYTGSYDAPSGHERLRLLYETDVEPVSRSRAAGASVPATFDELLPFLPLAQERIEHDGHPVELLTPSEATGRHLDFDGRPVWKILVNTAKSMQTSTVDGLTVGYWPDATPAFPALQQAGHWTGFRPGFPDLVRLYFGRGENPELRQTDLFEAFAAVCRDERSAREQIARYAVAVEGGPQLTPAQVPSLIAQHLPTSWLSPRSQWNAEIAEIRSPGQWIEPIGHPTDPEALRRNTELWRPLFDALTLTQTIRGPGMQEREAAFQARTGTVSHEELLSVLRRLEWSAPAHFRPHLTYLENLARTPDAPDCRNDWLLVAPQLSEHQPTAPGLGSGPLSLHKRGRRNGVFRRISNRWHQEAAAALVGPGEDTQAARGAVLLYPIAEHSEDGAGDEPAEASRLVIGFGIYTPKENGGPLVRLTAAPRGSV